MKFADAMNTPGMQTLLIAFLWLFMMVAIFAVRIRGIQITPEGITMLSDTSKMLLAILVYRMGGQAPAPPAPSKETK